ncbi:hypothetical protein [Enterococcus sp. DIV0970a]|uniref:hypothetical protein n=1 Tax=unclassified Enterococcus TaxID=2608891 RepID=UPI003F297E5F
MTVHGRKFVVRTRDSYVASDIELRNLVNVVEEKPADTLPLSAAAKGTFSFFHYDDRSLIGRLEEFCMPFKIQKTKKFEKNGKLAFLSPSGSVAISLNNYVVKISNDHYLVFDDKIFHQIFAISRN